MFRLIHISDLHYGPLPPIRPWQLANKRLIGWLNWRHNRGKAMESGANAALAAAIMRQPHDHLAISGDLVNLALPAEFANARGKIAAFGAAENVSLVFGNHDAYVPGALAKACAVFRPWIAGDAAGQAAGQGRPVAAPAAAGESAPLAAASPPARPSALFPYLRRRGPAAIIGVNSAIATPPGFAAGCFGAGQAARLKALLAQTRGQGLFRIIMIHHPPLAGAAPRRKKLWGIERFQRIIAEEGAELILHGHTHLASLSYISARLCPANPRGRAAVLGVASAAQEFGGRKPPAGYNLLEISGDKGSFTCRLRRFALTDSAGTIACVAEQLLLP